MSVIHMVACGMIEITRANFKDMRREVRLELQPFGLRLHTGNNQRFTLARRRGSGQARHGGHTKRAQVHHGDFISCCKAATKIITPPNHEEL